MIHNDRELQATQERIAYFQRLLAQLRVTATDVELSLIDRTLILQPLDEADRGQKLEAVTKTVFERRQSAYTRLAQGAE